MERCPVCQARFKEAICARCGSDLAPLLRIETQAASLEKRAVALLASKELIDAIESAKHVLELKRSPLALALLGLIRREVISQQVHTLEHLME